MLSVALFHDREAIFFFAANTLNAGIEPATSSPGLYLESET
jgi:hypothetical protein